jgi:hypothetical protein
MAVLQMVIITYIPWVVAGLIKEGTYRMKYAIGLSQRVRHSTRRCLSSVLRQFSRGTPVQYSFPLLQHLARHGVFRPARLLILQHLVCLHSLDESLMLCRHSADSSGINTFVVDVKHSTRSCESFKLNLLSLAAVSIEILSFGTYTYPIIFSMLEKHHGSHFP